MKKKLLCFLLLFVVLFSSIVSAQKDSLKAPQTVISQPKLKGYPITPFKDTLFYVYNKVGSFSAENRANAITEKIRKLYHDSFFESDSLVVVPSDISQDITYKEILLLCPFWILMPRSKMKAPRLLQNVI